ncbi:hypothetical protein E2C01_099743 [Portunus trituberculatus]|uniref:Uncharacterized protein n=1 Tax=Portunus trituberculatus TaxID=210409 RepID=A0A5B7KBH9_PORTR|nr:hypothetical protein [Portunus trituberculatus]
MPLDATHRYAPLEFLVTEGSTRSGPEATPTVGGKRRKK